jgi:predicted AlkP superfamily pyrophosphatase or phosphodiesterase
LIEAVRPMRLFKLGVLAAVALWLGACSTTATPPPRPVASAAAPRLTIMVSLDAFRPDYLTRGITPNLSAIAAEGVRATSVKPSFPSITFPNHYTLITGLRPDHHGLVNNIMNDPVLGHFDKPSDDPRWFAGGVPLWTTAEQAGIKSASVFWPGSIVPVNGIRPSYWATFKKTAASDRVDMLLAWLDLPPDKRPQFATLYIDEVDSAGHDFGPFSPQINTAVSTVDTAIGRLVAGLKARGLWANTNLAVMSDHGMAVIDPQRIDYAEDLIDPSLAKAINPGPFTSFALEPGQKARAEAILLAPHPNLQCWRKDQVPARFEYGKNPRVTPIVCLSNIGSEVRARGAKVGGGDHGFDPADPNMQAFFVARGPAFKHGVVLPPIDNVDIYPLMAKVLGVTPSPNDGNFAHTAGALQ